MRCDVIATGVINAAKKIGMKKPIVIRLQGTNVEQANELIANWSVVFVVVELTVGLRFSLRTMLARYETPLNPCGLTYFSIATEIRITLCFQPSTSSGSSVSTQQYGWDHVAPAPHDTLRHGTAVLTL